MLLEQVRTLASLRAQVQQLTTVRKQTEEEISSTPAGKRLADLRKQEEDCKEQVSKLEDDIRKVTGLEEFNNGAGTNPAPGITIKMYKVLQYDPLDALNWAKKNSPGLVHEILDVKSFEKVAVTLGAPVTEVVEPRVTIAKDLSEVL